MKPRNLVARCCGLVGATLTWSAAWGTTGTILFNPVGFPPQACQFMTKMSHGTAVPMYQPIPSWLSFALKSRPVYLIFMGKQWTADGTQSGKPVQAVGQIIAAAKDILSSSYLSGIKQYGSDGKAWYVDSYIDTCTNPPSNSGWQYVYPGTNTASGNPAWFETKRAISSHADCPNPHYVSWAPPAGVTDATNSPIYVTVHYDDTGGWGGGSNGSGFGPNGNYLSAPANVIDDYTVPTNVDAFSLTFSHEVVEQMSTGTGSGGQCTYASQIADGESEYASYFVRLSAPSSPLVPAYWSVTDQAFIVPGGNIPDGFSDNPVARVLLNGLWNSDGGHASLRQGVLSYIIPDRPFVPPFSGHVIDKQIQTFTIDSSTIIHALNVSGQVISYDRLSPALWSRSVLTPPGYVASKLVTSRASSYGQVAAWGVGGDGLYMLASNNGATPQVWKYTGSGSSWTALNDTNTAVSDIAAITTISQGGRVWNSLYMLAGIGATRAVWQYTNSGTVWIPTTTSGMNVEQIAVANGDLYMLASYNGGSNQVWICPGAFSCNWQPITPTTWRAQGLWVAGDILFTRVADQIYQYVPTGTGVSPSTSTANWTVLTGSNTYMDQWPLVQDGVELYLSGNNGGGFQIWEFQGIGSLEGNTTFGWYPLTQTGTYQQVTSMGLTASDILSMHASKNGGPSQLYKYTGVPNSWSP